ncbi:MAG: YebC/PmpR family DNA-binding transcriptional regulator [Candidatus Bipolaricaulota bacterium]|nr:YebC/PmpR family DNA-binding transcriptional regulator [Candidatus Bipolaricaulota bacterium]MCS7273812.1 YebC/PmpR family DNA-binding transcriptional regulator [Candidatus Bipolaricaulota bacterium]MDW8110770.1 YebC/PmpR family DNA-binding transcriptional regulator [Candidatus Bipolaricaulota bacterium]MDW8328372.1 YebC/PmpR family DNA-binding transcriptional regulator [Candidatus Bipolaricaulota bacterium]
MAGHSKWANIKYRKERQDAAKMKIFSKLAKEIMMAAKAGSPDPAQNIALANAIERARAANVPKENIERAIKRATGELPGAQYEEIFYEGYGPYGVAVMVRVVTDNRNRAVSEIRRIFEQYGGNLGGSVAWLFTRRGVITLDKKKIAQERDELLMRVIDLGVEDLQEKDGEIELYCEPSHLKAVREALERQAVPIERAEVQLVPQNTVPLTGPEAEKFLKFMSALDDQEDVQEVYANFDIPEDVMDRLS